MTEQDFEEGYFTFRQFRVKQQRSAMKVGTDAVLLGAWMPLPSTENPHLLDIGTGTGVISLFAAQRLSTATGTFSVTGIEPDTPSFEEAAGNFSNSPWSDSLTALNLSLQEYSEHAACGNMDLIFSNPPYFSSSLKPPDSRRSASRHTETLSFNEMVEICGRLLKTGGMLAVILPPQEAENFSLIARSHQNRGRHFILSRICNVLSTPEKPVKRIMLAFTLTETTPINTPAPEPELLVLQDGPARSAQYTRLTEQFYVR